ncbi:helix-turn-helix transcriptional regulator [Halorientalis salina]|uniref:helix-turn-helix transcriptional regulator n=1 Tax=Halorientalis salina TaxID=2932266 RepID=UPI002022AF60|nr:DUF4897 domain-containing protein [Halorientalis salina]
MSAGDAVAQQSQPDVDNTVTRIEVNENGSAHWTIQIRTRLDTEQREDEYAAFQEQFRDNTTQYLGPFQTRMQGTVADAANATGRQMRATNFTASTSVQEVPRQWGIVTYEFTWTNFAAQQNGQVVVGDVFQGGFFIAESDTLEIIAPMDHEIVRTDPQPDSQEGDMVAWDGREDFDDTNPTVVFAPAPNQTDATTDSDGPIDSSPPTGDGSFLDTLGLPVLVLLIVIGLVGIVAAVMYRRRSSGTSGQGAAATEAGESQPSTQQTASGGTASGAAMTDEERVIDLLEANDGRMRQAEIAEEFDWSASKTSRVIGNMADEDSVEKLRIGRENLVALNDDQ